MVTQSSKPDGRSLSDFKKLNTAEQRLREKCRIGEPTVITESEKADTDYTIRASFVRFLALGGDAHAPVHEKGVILEGALVHGELNLMNAYLPHSLKLNNCQLSNVDLSNSNIHGFLDFSYCHIECLVGSYMVCSGSVSLINALITIGPADLVGAQIGGNLNCKKGTFYPKDGYALKCIGAAIKGNVFLDEDFTAFGTVDLMAIQIGGSLACNIGKFDAGKKENALICDGAVIEGDILLGRNFTANGTPLTKYGFNATGIVRLVGVQIGKSLACNGGKFDGKNHQALLCDRAVIKGSVFLGKEFTAIGKVSLSNAQIGGDLECNNGKFDVIGKNYALICCNAVIEGSVSLDGEFTATDRNSLSNEQIGGGVDLSGVHIRGRLNCRGATFECPDGVALNGDGMTIAGMFSFVGLKSISGGVYLTNAKVASLIDDSNSWQNGKMIIDGFVYDRFVGTSPDAKTRLAWLNKPQPWQQLQKVLREMGHFEGARQVGIAFEDRLREANLIGQTPKKWCTPRVWIYRETCCVFHRLFGWLIGYGYRPLELFFKIFIVWLVFGFIYWGAAVYGNNGNGVFAPSNPLVFQNPEYAVCVPDSKEAMKEKTKPYNEGSLPIQGAGNWYLCINLRQEYTGFSPFAYSLDLILPLVDLQQENDWAPMIPTPTKTSAFWTWAPSHEYLIRFLMWFEILFGWIASLLLVAVFSGLTKRREE